MMYGGERLQNISLKTFKILMKLALWNFLTSLTDLADTKP